MGRAKAEADSAVAEPAYREERNQYVPTPFRPDPIKWYPRGGHYAKPVRTHGDMELTQEQVTRQLRRAIESMSPAARNALRWHYLSSITMAPRRRLELSGCAAPPSAREIEDARFSLIRRLESEFHGAIPRYQLRWVAPF